MQGLETTTRANKSIPEGLKPIARVSLAELSSLGRDGVTAAKQ